MNREPRTRAPRRTEPDVVVPPRDDVPPLPVPPLPDLSPHVLLVGETRDLPACRIRRLSPDGVKGLAEGLFAALSPDEPDIQVARFLDELEQARIVEREGALPLLVSIACVVYARSAERRLPGDHALLYEEFVGSLLGTGHSRCHDVWAQLPERLRRWARRDGLAAVESLIDRRRELAEYLAAAAVANDATALLDLAVRQVEDLRPAVAPVEQWREIVAEVLRRCGPLVEQFGDFAFLHPRIRDYLAACHFARVEEPKTEILYLAADPSLEAFVQFLAAKWSERGHTMEGIIRALLDEEDLWLTEVAAAVAGAGIGSAVRAEITARLQRWIDDPATRWVDRELALDRLVRLDPAAGATVLTRMAGVENQARAARWLAEIDPGRGIAELRRLAGDARYRQEAAPLLLEVDRTTGLDVLIAVATDRDEGFGPRRNAAASVAAADEHRAAELFAALATDDGVEFEDRLSAAGELARLDRDRGIELLRDQLDQHPDPRDRTRVAMALREFAAQESTAVLRAVATSPAASGPVRAEAAAWLTGAEPDEAVSLLVGLAVDDTADDESRGTALMWLHEMARGDGTSLLERVAAEDPDPGRRGHARAALGRLGDGG